MIALFKGLGILLRDNELYSSPFDKQVAHWRNLSEQQIRDEVAVLAQAKCQWLIASIVGWQAASLLILGLIANYLWRDDFHITFTRVVVVFGSWVSILFVIWFMANMFDQQAGELETVAATQAAGELLLHCTKPATAQELHAHAAIAADGADRQAVPQRLAAIVHAVAAIGIAHDLVEIGVLRQRLPTLHDEVQHGPPLFIAQRGEGMGATHLRQQRITVKAASEGAADRMLCQHVQ